FALMKFNIKKISAVFLCGLLSVPACLFSPKSQVFAEESDASDLTDQEMSYQDTPITSFRVENLSPGIETDLDYTDWWYSEWENCHYIFLPATADREKLVITCCAGDDDMTIALDDQAIQSGKMTSVLGEADEFHVTADEIDCGTLRVMQSNLGCIYLTTSHGGLDALDSNRGIVETGSTLMLNYNGGIEYQGEIGKLKSHGNSSWDYSRKKPYNINLPQKANLYGMGKAKKWALLGNYLDHSMLRNKMTFEISRAAGMDYVMDSVFVDLYADGSYRGTYQLSERVQIQKNRVNIHELDEETELLNEKELKEYERKSVNAGIRDYVQDSYKYYDIPNNPEDITGGYLLEFKMNIRYPGAKSGFVTTRGQAFEIKSPEYATQQQVEYIKNYVQEMEDAIYSPDGCNALGKHYTEYIDLDSLIKGYLIEEISMDTDSYHESFFLWKDRDSSGDGKLHCSPVWDFDFAYYNYSAVRGNWDGDVGYSWDSHNLFAAFFPISGYNSELGKDSPTSGVSWIGTLYKRGDIVKRTAEIYFEDFYPYLCALTDTEQDGGAILTRIGDEITPSADMNNARWHMYGGAGFKVFGPKHGDNYTECVEFLRKFTKDRTDWLTQLWKPLVSEEEDVFYQMGDVNLDGRFNQRDLIMLQDWLHSKGMLTYWKAADFNQDGKINIYDLCLMKTKLKQ
ncbi:MAG: CotH kinase family protein, partial [Oscillospiraceae bacterium]|nr:CotH kinase family protein [Oscillospiraceae bacterium]